MFGKKELGVVLRTSSISFEGRVVEMVVSGACGVTLDPEAHASHHQVIRVHTRVGDMDSGVHRVESRTSVGRATSVATFLGLTDFGVTPWNKNMPRFSHCWQNFHWRRLGDLAVAFGATREGFFPGGSAMRCRIPSRSVTQEMDPKWKTSLTLKVIMVLKVIDGVVIYQRRTPTWRASCRCL
jgi:hypothetical protein